MHDSGIGIPLDSRDKLFQPFLRRSHRPRGRTGERQHPNTEGRRSRGCGSGANRQHRYARARCRRI